MHIYEHYWGVNDEIENLIIMRAKVFLKGLK